MWFREQQVCGAADRLPDYLDSVRTYRELWPTWIVAGGKRVAVDIRKRGPPELAPQASKRVGLE